MKKLDMDILQKDGKMFKLPGQPERPFARLYVDDDLSQLALFRYKRGVDWDAVLKVIEEIQAKLERIK